MLDLQRNLDPVRLVRVVIVTYGSHAVSKPGMEIWTYDQRTRTADPIRIEEMGELKELEQPLKVHQHHDDDAGELLTG